MNERHGAKSTKLYGVWSTMKSRCYNPCSDHYKKYGKKGIRVCTEWLDSFTSFRNWAIANGYAEGKTLDRRDTTKGYSPDNCRWVDQKTQQRNRSNNVYIEAFGERKLRVERVEDPRCVVSFHTLRRRLKLGWSTEDAISKPLAT